jgi:hypothetical protein
VGHAACTWYKHAFAILVSRPEEERLFSMLQIKWEGNIKMDLTKIGWKGVNCIRLIEVKDR